MFLLYALVSGWLPAVTSVDVEQHRLNFVPPAAVPGQPLKQSFQAGNAGLSEVEILLAQTGGREGDGLLTLALTDQEGQTIASRQWEVRRLDHNQPLVLRFPPQNDSAGKTYIISLQGNAQNSFSAWAYDLNVYEGGALGAGEAADAGDLRFITRYDLLPGPALAFLAQRLRQDGPLWLLALAYTLLPGCLLLLAAGRHLPRLDPAAWWGLALVLGVAAWPLLWFWLTIVGGRWTPTVLGWTVLAGWSGAAILWLRNRRRLQLSIAGWHRQHLLLLLILLSGLAVRLLAVRDLAFLPWVDASRHALITAVMSEQGQTLQTYAPYLPVSRFPYHFGLHTLTAGVDLLGEWPMRPMLLSLGQWLNALIPLTVYTAGWLLTRRRPVGLLAAFLVAVPFLFPAYYVTWGRLTQLAGVLLLPVVLALTWKVLSDSRTWGRHGWLLSLLVAGLLLIHFRVFLLYLPFAILAWLAARGRGSGWLALAAALALLLSAPRLLQLVRLSEGSGLLSPATSSYTRFPVNYLTTGWERAFWLAGGAAWLLAAFAAVRGRRWARLVLLLAAWPALVTLLLSGQILGLPTLWLVNLNSAYIVFFVPLALVLALATGQVWHLTGRLPRLVEESALVVAGAGLAALLLFGVHQQIDILNPTTILARPQDVVAIDWVERNLPEDAKIAVNSWQWLGRTWAGSDGGAWLLPLTGRAVTTPPADYVYNRSLFQEVDAFNETAMAVGDWSTPAAAAWLRAQAVTHVFVGARGGFFDPAELARNPRLEQVYAWDGVFVFALLP